MIVRSLPIVAAMLLVGASAAAQELDCPSIIEQFQATGQDLGRLDELHTLAQRHCDAKELDVLSNNLGNSYFNAALQAPEQDQKQLLSQAAQYGKDWRIFAALGEVQLRDGDRAGAAQNLQWAIMQLKDNPPEPAPQPETVERLLAMANNARATAKSYVRVLRNRSDQPDGVAAREVAGVAIEAVPFPIEFVFAEANLTPDGEIAVQDLADILNAEEGASITLAGHTDPVGSDEYNQRLSIERAEAIRSRLLSQGFGSRLAIEIVGCGEQHPPRIENPEHYSEEEVHQIMRRVELVRSGGGCS